MRCRVVQQKCSQGGANQLIFEVLGWVFPPAMRPQRGFRQSEAAHAPRRRAPRLAVPLALAEHATDFGSLQVIGASRPRVWLHKSWALSIIAMVDPIARHGRFPLCD
jgi:hypothetical protein